jgi:hypothetical protein
MLESEKAGILNGIWPFQKFGKLGSIVYKFVCRSPCNFCNLPDTRAMYVTKQGMNTIKPPETLKKFCLFWSFLKCLLQEGRTLIPGVRKQVTKENVSGKLRLSNWAI